MFLSPWRTREEKRGEEKLARLKSPNNVLNMFLPSLIRGREMRGPVGGNELVARGSCGSLNFDTQHKQLLSRIFSHTTKICTHTHTTKALHCRQESKPTPLISISVWYYTWHWRPPRRREARYFAKQVIRKPLLLLCSPLCAPSSSLSR